MLIKKNVKIETEHLHRAITLADRIISLVQVERLVYEINTDNENNPYENIYQDIIAVLDKLLDRYKTIMVEMSTQPLYNFDEYYRSTIVDDGD